MTARLGSIAALLVVCAGVAACDDTTPTSPDEVTLDVNTFSNLVVPGGSAARELTLIAPGQIAVTLTSTSPAGIVVGVGIGIPRANSTCALATAVETAAGSGPHVSVAAEAGRHCVKVYDPGTLAAPASFTLSISRP